PSRDDECSGSIVLLQEGHVGPHPRVDLREIRLVSELDDEHASGSFAHLAVPARVELTPDSAPTWVRAESGWLLHEVRSPPWTFSISSTALSCVWKPEKLDAGTSSAP